MNHSFIATVVSLTVSGIAHADVTAGKDKARLCSLFCHNNERYAGSLAPLLEGQPAPYLYNQLKAFKEKRRANTRMDVPTSSMTEDDMRDISEFFAAQPIPATPFKPDPSKVAIGAKAHRISNVLDAISPTTRARSISPARWAMVGLPGGGAKEFSNWPPRAWCRVSDGRRDESSPRRD
jgi:cytochrome c553